MCQHERHDLFINTFYCKIDQYQYYGWHWRQNDITVIKAVIDRLIVFQNSTNSLLKIEKHFKCRVSEDSNHITQYNLCGITLFQYSLKRSRYQKPTTETTLFSQSNHQYCISQLPVTKYLYNKIQQSVKNTAKHIRVMPSDMISVILQHAEIILILS